MDQRYFAYINSNNRTSGTHSNFNYQIPVNTYGNVDRVALIQCDIPKSYYLINSTNNTFQLYENGTTTNVVLQSGCYNVSQIIVEITRALNAATILSATSTYSVSFPSATSPQTGKFTFLLTSTVNTHVIRFVFTTQVYEQMGFNLNSTNTLPYTGTPFTYSTTSVNVIKLQVESSLYIKTNLISDPTQVLSSVFASTALDFSSIIFQQTTDIAAISKEIAVNKSNSYWFQITNEDNVIVDLNGINCNFVLVFYKANNFEKFVIDSIKYFIENSN